MNPVQNQFETLNTMMKHPFREAKAAIKASPAKALLAVVLGVTANYVMPLIPGFQADRYKVQRSLNQLQLQHTYQVRHLGQLGDMHPGRILGSLKNSFSHSKTPVQAKATEPTPKVCDPRKPYPKAGEQWCRIPADVLEEHCHPGVPNPHSRTWPGEGDPIGPDPTRIHDWKNCDNVRNFNKAITGQLSPEQTRQAANDALGDVNPKLNVDNVGKVMPLINDVGRGGAGLPIDTYHTPDPQFQIPAPPADQLPPTPAPIIRRPPQQPPATPQL